LRNKSWATLYVVIRSVLLSCGAIAL